jgi:ATP-dependent DNA helicase RecQ
MDVAAFTELCRAHRDTLGDARQQARFLCGLSSPAAVRARLTRHALFGQLNAYRFGEVLAWLSGSRRDAV